MYRRLYSLPLSANINLSKVRRLDSLRYMLDWTVYFRPVEDL